jgi:hypothetical protein
MTRGWRSASFATALAVAVLVPCTFSIADPVELNVKVAKHADGPYQASGLRVNLGSGDSRSVYAKVRSTADHRQKVILTEEVFPEPIDYETRWFRGKRGISHAVKHAGFEFKLAAGDDARFRIRVTAHHSPDPACLDGRFHVEGATQDAFSVFALNGDPGSICSG